MRTTAAGRGDQRSMLAVLVYALQVYVEQLQRAMINGICKYGCKDVDAVALIKPHAVIRHASCKNALTIYVRRVPVSSCGSGRETVVVVSIHQPVYPESVLSYNTLPVRIPTCTWCCLGVVPILYDYTIEGWTGRT